MRNNNAEDQLARAEARRELAEIRDRRRAETFAEYNAEGIDRRNRSSELKQLRLLKEARDRAAAKANPAPKKRVAAR